MNVSSHRKSLRLERAFIYGIYKVMFCTGAAAEAPFIVVLIS